MLPGQSKVLENLFSKALAKAEKSAVPLHPASIGGGKVWKAKQKRIKFFSRKAWQIEKASYLCTPKSKEGKQNERRCRPKGHSATSNGSSKRSLNDWKRQMVRFISSNWNEPTTNVTLIWTRQIRVGLALDISPGSPGCRNFYNGEFDLGSGWTLAAGLIHASRTVSSNRDSGARVRNA